MEELNNVLEGTMEVVEPVEAVAVSEVLEEGTECSGKSLVIGAVVVTGVIAGGIALKKFWNKRKKSKEESIDLDEGEFKDVEQFEEVESNE